MPKGQPVPPPQCPECGRFLATAFVEKIQHTPSPCPRCGTELSLEDASEPAAVEDDAAIGGPPAAPSEAALEESVASAEDTTPTPLAGRRRRNGVAQRKQVGGPPAAPREDAVEVVLDDEPATPEDQPVSAPAASAAPAVGEPEPATARAASSRPSAVATLDDEPEHEESVRPPDLADEGRDPLEGWDRDGTPPVLVDDREEVTEVAVGAGVGLLAGLLLGGRGHRALGGFLGALLGALLARLRG